ncbi:AI-2E family transporter [Methyloversatilis sp.]|uniref:AI-2E family transporter n=1 Tax=Methyloversatilis sp. TaxID=2569862 RepID=UPI0035AEE715
MRRLQPSGAGPLAWCGILLATTLTLYLFQHVLWLVLPFLFGLIAYYFLYPPMQRLMFAGFSQAAAANITVGVFALLLSACLVLTLPWFAAHAVSAQDIGQRYLQGGMVFLDDTMRALEARSRFMRDAHVADELSAHIAAAGAGFAQERLPTMMLAVAAWLPSFLLAPFLAYFFLRDGRRFQRFLARAVPNAFFERTLHLLYELDRTTRAYFQGLIKLTLLDAACLAGGLWMIGLSSPLMLGLVTAVLAWIPFVGSILGCALVVMVAATDFPGSPSVAYSAIGLFVCVRLLDDFVFMPLTIGRSLKMHPLITVLMIFVGGAVAGVAGLLLVLPVLGVVMVIGETASTVAADPRLHARHAHARRLRLQSVTRDLG